MGPHSFEAMPMQVGPVPPSSSADAAPKGPVRKVSDFEGLVIGPDDDFDTDDDANEDLENVDLQGAAKSSTFGRPVLRSIPSLAETDAGSTADADASTSNCAFDKNLRSTKSSKNPPSFYGRFRTREQIIIHFLLELQMLRTDFAVIIFGLFFQFFHSVMTNLAYYYHAKLTAAQRMPLADMLFDALPVFSGPLWMVSEYIMFTFIFIIVTSIVSILAVRWNTPHGRPLYCIPIVRRMLMTLVACQTLRIISFMITTLPGASRQCLYHVPDDITAKEMVEGPAPDAGNPSGWNAPTTMYDVLFRVDATNGCGDLMFSSHTIFTMLFVCVIFKYFNWKFMKRLMVLLQMTIVPFILASHKHYSVDVFTALYVTPLVFEMLWIRFPDKDHTSLDLANHYGLRFYLAPTGAGFGYVVGMWGREYYIDEADDLPVDLNYTRKEKTEGKTTDASSKNSGDRRKKPSPSEVSPLIV